MKILLLNCPISWGTIEGVADQPPMGLLYLLEYIKQNNVSVEIELFDPVVAGYGVEETVIELNKKEYDILGINVTTPLFNIVRKIIEEVKTDRRPLCVLGGPHPTLLPNETLLETIADIVVIGDGEETFSEIIKSYSEQSPYNNILGIAYIEDGKVITTKKRPLNDNLIELPLPFQDKNIIANYLGDEKKAYMVSSRGCPQECIYCSSPAICGRKWRYRNVSSIIKEVNYYQEEFKIREIHFLDDNFTANRKRLYEFCSEIKPLNIKWRALSRVGLNNDLLDAMKDSGCYKLSFGIESGNNEILAKIKKKISIDKARDTLSYCKNIGISTKTFFMIGFPFERIEQVVDTINLAVEFSNLYDSSVAFNIVKPYPGTELMLYVSSLPGFRLIKPDASLSEEEKHLVTKFGEYPYPSINPYFTVRDLLTFIEIAYVCCNKNNKVSVSNLLSRRGIAGASNCNNYVMPNYGGLI